jgi:hypothetical protein
MILFKNEVQPVLRNKINGSLCWCQGDMVMSNSILNYISSSIYKHFIGS